MGTFHLHILPRQMCPCWDLHVESSKRCVISQILSPLALLRVQGRAAADKAGVEGLPRRRGLHAMDEILIFEEEMWITAVISGTEAVSVHFICSQALSLKLHLYLMWPQ